MQGMYRFAGAVIEDDKRREWIGPPPTKQCIEEQPNKDRSCEVCINESDPSFGQQNLVLQLLSSDSLAKCEQQHHDKGCGDPDDANRRWSRMDTSEERVD